MDQTIYQHMPKANKHLRTHGSIGRFAPTKKLARLVYRFNLYFQAYVYCESRTVYYVVSIRKHDTLPFTCSYIVVKSVFIYICVLRSLLFRFTIIAK